MTFNEQNVNRDQAGKFGEKTGSKPEDIELDSGEQPSAVEMYMRGAIDMAEQRVGALDTDIVKAGDLNALHGAVERLQLDAVSKEGRKLLRELRPGADTFVVALDAEGEARVFGYDGRDGRIHVDDTPDELHDWLGRNATYFERPGVLAENRKLYQHDPDDWDSDPCYLV